MKPIGRKNYGSIPHLHHSKLGPGDYFIGEGQEKILTQKKRDRHDTIFVFEKYDGSNVGISKHNGQIVALTRSGYLADKSPFSQHHLFSKWVEKKESIFKELLNEGERITGEWLALAHGLLYQIEGDPIVFFDLFNPENERILNDELKEKTNLYGLQLPRKLHQGDPIKVEELLPVLNQKTPGMESQEMPEGMVFRVERKGKVDFLAKWVRSDFTAGKYCINIEEDKLIWNISPDKIGL
jgi:ATP-dependent RNA circularization protein (DNA/RNA ligase family)